MAAQLMATIRLPALGLSSCRARAKRSLPVPLAPNSNVVMSVGAIFSTVRHTFSISGLTAMMSRSGMFSLAFCRRRFSRSSAYTW